jgi:3-hydroxyacyl-CoA dehydrogenase
MRVPEITDSIVNVDNAQKWGFNHEMGPFEIWDAIGVAETVGKFEEAGYPVAGWVKAMLAQGNQTFYQSNEQGQVIGYYSPQAGAYVAIEKDPLVIRIADLKAEGRQVWSNGDGNLYDLGDGVLLWEFATKQNTITRGFVDAGYHALEMLKSPQWKGLVISNDAERFSIGANLMEVMSGMQDGGIDGVSDYIKALQHLTRDLVYAPKPVVTAPFNMALGGGCEMALASARIVAHAELYIGLVEFGVGLIPAGGGVKELLRRNVNPVAASGSGDLLPVMQKVFENIATAKVSESAMQAREMGFLTGDDVIVMNRDHLIGEAKAVVLALAVTYQQREPDQIYAAGRDAFAALNIGIAGFRESGFASDHDAVIAKELARIMSGGAVAQAGWYAQDYFLTLERESFKKLLMEPKSQERMMYMLQNNKPLRN